MRSAKITRSRVAAAAVTVSLAAAGAVGLAATSEAAVATYQVTPKTGPGGTNSGGQPASAAKVVTISASGATTFKSGAGTVKVGAVNWAATVATCAPNAQAVTSFSVPTGNTVVATVPANTLALTATTTGGVTTYSKKDYYLCVYDVNATPANRVLLGTAKYTVYPTPTITAAVGPTKGPVSGGGTIAIDGTGFTAASVVKIGTTAATQVKVSTDGKSLTAKVPAGTTGATTVTVTTEGGVNATPATAAWDDYTYVNAISVSPDSGDGTAGNVITVTGVGFTSLTAASRVYLNPDGAFDDAAAPSLAIAPANYQVVSDTQLVVTLPTVATDAAYTVNVVVDPADELTATAVSASATYTVADF